MADEPISALTQIAVPPFSSAFTNPSTGAMLEILDTTNTTMASSGTNSKVAPGDLIKGYLAAGSNVTLTETSGIVTIAASGGGLAVGNAITGGSANGLLYQSTTGSTLAISSTVQTNGTQLGVGAIDTTYGALINVTSAGLAYINVQSTQTGITNSINFGIENVAGQFGYSTQVGDALFKWRDSNSMRFVTNDCEFVHLQSTGGSQANTQIGFFGVATSVQPTSGHVTTLTGAGSTGQVYANSTFSGGTGSSNYTIGDIVLALKQLGLIAS